MSRSTTHRFLLRLPHMGRQISDEDWQHIEPEAALQIRHIQNALNNETINNNGITYQFKLDIEPIAKSLDHYYDSQKKFDETKDWAIWTYYKERDCDCFIECNVTSSEACHHNAEPILQFLIYEIFIIMCITVPGVFNLDGAEFINIPERRSVTGSIITYDVGASSSLPENYHYETKQQEWLPRTDVDAMQTSLWLRRIYPRFNMLADNPASRCVLALLYLCKGDAYSGAGAPWLFNGLESLFGCKPGENRAALTRRIGILLELDRDQIPHLKKAIGELYNLRSSFVHGGLATVHPIRDERVNDEVVRVMRAMDKGIAILLTVIRKLISKNIDWPRFEETMAN